jgi:type VI secretion system ImpB/VipA family protein
MSTSGQKFVARNRAPRVQIEYDVELYGAEKKVQLPFVMGVLADLSGNAAEALPSVADRKFLEIDVDNFDDRMKSMKPRAAFTVPNTLTGDGNLSVDITFESMDDFSPAAIARKIEPLRALLEARTRLTHLTTYMDGKTGAEDLIAKLVSDPATLAALTGVTGPEGTAGQDRAKALDALRSTAPTTDEPAADDTQRALDSLRALPTGDAPDGTEETRAALESLRGLPVDDSAAEGDEMRAAFDRLREMSVHSPDDEDVDASGAALEALRVAAAFSASETPSPQQGGLTGDDEGEEPVEEDEVDLDALLSDAGSSDDDEDEEPVGEDEIDLDALLSDAGSSDDDEDGEPVEEDEVDLDALLSDAGSSDDDEDGEPVEEDEVDLDALLSDAGSSDDDEDGEPVGEDEIDLDALLSDAGSSDDDEDGEPVEDDEIDLDALLSDDDESALDDEEEDDEDLETARDDPFGILSADRPEDREAPRAKFRIALLGDFSGRASRGDLEIGDGLANRKPIKFDIDNIDAVIARFATTLVLPIGTDGMGIEVKLNSLDDLHPDELYENVALFEELSALRQRVASGNSNTIKELRSWAEDQAPVVRVAHARAKGSAVPADRKLSDFQSLIGDMQGRLAHASPADEIIGRIVGPYIQAAPDPARETVLAALDEALSGAMRAILHHPDFQAVESTWRSLDFLARRVETSGSMEIVLYDVSAEEWAADLAAQEDLADSGLFRMLAEEPRLDAAQGPLSAVFGLYTLEETPPHAELLARMAKISDWMNAPFVTAISPEFLKTPKHERHPLVAKAWDALRGLDEAAYLGLVAPRFLLRLPYGAKSEPVDPFNFEEFTLRSGLNGMLWANPVVLSAILMAATAVRMGKTMQLGEIMSLGDIPVHTMVDQYGDQIALPCTERLLNTRTTAEVVSRGVMPVLSIKGRNEVRQGSFQALGGEMLAGPWALTAGQGRPAFGTEIAFGVGKSAGDGQSASAKGAKPDDGEEDEEDDQDQDLDFDFDSSDDDDTDFDSSDDDDTDLDDLLSQFDEDREEEDSEDDDDVDAALAALLEDL